MFNNVFHKTGIYYFPAPHEVFASAIWSELESVSHSLYPFILSKAWELKDGQTAVSLTSEEITTGTGLSVNSVTKARADLEAKGLIHPVRGKGG